MAQVVDNNIEKLREKSRILLARVSKNFKRINNEVRKLRSQTLSLINYYNYECHGNYIGGNIDLWKLRNDSSGVGAVLCPDLSHNSPKYTITSAPDMTSSAKLTLTSKKSREECARIVLRKPVKDCYCYSEANKIYTRALKIQQAPMSPYRQCKSQFELKLSEETNNRATLISPISCETFRRMRKINYTPRSQFLRNVQNKICELQSGGQGDCLRTCPRSSSYHRFRASAKMQGVNFDNKAMLPVVERVEEQKSPITLTVPMNSTASESDNNACMCLCKRIASQRQPKSTLRKTISSKGSISKSPTRTKQMTESRKQNCRYCCKDELKRSASRLDKHEEKRVLPEYHEPRTPCLRYDDVSVAEDSADQEVENLKKFREQNYFETHGSSHTLVSSRSSGSLQQYLLNERLFPEPVGKIHRQDLVVTMPSCATTQKKHIHYFPRHIVRQEKNVCNTNYRRKRYQSCPLTGHAIDLGVLKARPPLNSLALKYQKRTP